MDEKPKSGETPPEAKPWSRALVTVWTVTYFFCIALIGGMLLYFAYVLVFG
jgi:hypothetical protein